MEYSSLVFTSVETEETVEENSSNDVNMSQISWKCNLHMVQLGEFLLPARSIREFPTKNNISDDFCQFYPISFQYKTLCLPILLPRINLLCLPISPNYTVLGLPGIYLVRSCCQQEILQIYISSDKREFEHPRLKSNTL